jgi:hypothetical protein
LNKKEPDNIEQWDAIKTREDNFLALSDNKFYRKRRDELPPYLGKQMHLLLLVCFSDRILPVLCFREFSLQILNDQHS